MGLFWQPLSDDLDIVFTDFRNELFVVHINHLFWFGLLCVLTTRILIFCFIFFQWTWQNFARTLENHDNCVITSGAYIYCEFIYLISTSYLFLQVFSITFKLLFRYTNGYNYIKEQHHRSRSFPKRWWFTVQVLSL